MALVQLGIFLGAWIAFITGDEKWSAVVCERFLRACELSHAPRSPKNAVILRFADSSAARRSCLGHLRYEINCDPGVGGHPRQPRRQVEV